MSDQPTQRTQAQVDVILSNPKLLPYIQVLPSGEKVIPVDVVRILLSSVIDAGNETMKAMLTTK
jgi:hypothetical protein